MKSRGYKFSGSNDLNAVAWYIENSGGGKGIGSTRPVAQKAMNELGIYDMSGNVWEWCEDLHDNNNRCVRGGGYYNWIGNLRVGDSVFNNFPEDRADGVGLRLARNSGE